MGSGAPTEFQFIAHDASTKNKRQIPTAVRSHVMQRFHRERRANNAAANTKEDTGTNPVWSQHEVVVPDLHGQVLLQWENEEQPVAISQVVKPRKEKLVSRQLTKTRRSKVKEGRNMEEFYTSPDQSLTQTSESESTHDSDYLKADYNKMVTSLRRRNDQYQSMKSFMPDNDMERGGMQLLRILDDYFNLVGDRGNYAVWASLSFSDDVVFHASMFGFKYILAASCGAVSTIATDKELLKHKGTAMKTLASSLADSKIPTDSAIASAMCLTGSELLSQNSDRSVVKAHIYGMRRMIAMRGGVRGLNRIPYSLPGYLCYEYVLAVLDIEYDPVILEALSVPSPYYVILPFETGIFSMARKKFDPTQFGFSHDAVLLLSAICRHINISDVFVYSSISNKNDGNTLENLLGRFEERESGTGSWDLDANLEDHVLQALLLTISLQFSRLVTLIRLRSTSSEDRVQQLQHHIISHQSKNYWRPLPEVSLNMDTSCRISSELRAA